MRQKMGVETCFAVKYPYFIEFIYANPATGMNNGIFRPNKAYMVNPTF
jgi:hypothetical protein